MSRQQRFLARKHSFAPGGDPAALFAPPTDPTSLPHLLWWDDVNSISPTPANNTTVTSVPVFPGTPGTQLGVNVALGGEFGGGFPATYFTAGMANGNPAIDFGIAPGGLLSHQGAALTNYALTSNGGLTIYVRAHVYGFTPNEIVSLGKNFVGPKGIDWGYSVPAGGGMGNIYVNIQPTGPTGFGSIITGDYTLAAVIQNSGTYSFYLNGAVQGTAASSGVALETSNSGYGYQFGNPNVPYPKYRLSACLGYQALHTAQQVSRLSAWLKTYR